MKYSFEMAIVKAKNEENAFENYENKQASVTRYKTAEGDTISINDGENIVMFATSTMRDLIAITEDDDFSKHN